MQNYVTNTIILTQCKVALLTWSKTAAECHLAPAELDELDECHDWALQQQLWSLEIKKKKKGRAGEFELFF